MTDNDDDQAVQGAPAVSPTMPSASHNQSAPAVSVQTRNKTGQWKKGHSGNANGRPVRRERSYLPRQRRRDILAVTEEMLPINTERGTIMMSAFEIALRKVRKRAFDNHGPSMRLFLQMHCEALLGHFEAHQKEAEGLESLEAAIVMHGEPIGNRMEKSVNIGRKKSRTT